jgi:DNA-directed RNA polymerase specialized sigma24 family protein
MPDSAIAVAEFEAICRQAAVSPKTDSGDYRPTANQVFFFSLVWLQKRKVAFKGPTDRLRGQKSTQLRSHARQVAHHLDEWGATVSRLKRREATAWELLRVQLEKAIRRYHNQPETARADALQEALLKIFQLLDKMIVAHDLDETRDIVSLVVKQRSRLTNIYDFSSPFYPYAKQIVRNELITQIRKEMREPIYPGAWEDVVFQLPAVPAPPNPGDEDLVREARLLQLRIDLTRLLALIQRDLTPKAGRVICQTLAARPQFWRALKMTDLSPAKEFPPPFEPATDADLAAALSMTPNAVRVHRAQTKKQVQEMDAILGRLLEVLLARHS